MRLALALVLLAAPTCVPQQPSDPATTFRAYAQAIERGDVNTAWGLLSAPTQAKLTEAAKKVAQLEGKPAPQDGKLLAFGEPTSHPKIKRVDEGPVAGDSATVQVIDEGDRAEQVRLVREQGRWKVDLSEALQR